MLKLLLVIVIATALSALLTGLEIPMLIKLKTGQNIREEGPQAHLAKAGTPSMGGIAIILSFTILAVAGIFILNFEASKVLCIVFATLAYGAIGFYDDYLKIVKHQNEGLSSRQKMTFQLAVGIVFSLYRYFFGSARVYIPFYGNSVDFGFWIIPFTLFVFVAMTNAVNLTDGLDGLSSSVTSVASFFTGIACLGGFGVVRHVIIYGGADIINPTSTFLAFVLCGCCLGFLVFNRHPAKLFMGDTGSLALGACLSSIAMSEGLDFTLPIIGIIYVVEALSVIIQVVVFKTQNGRRFFRMAPIHHHFELGGWSEVKVAAIFSSVTLVMGVIALLIFR